MKLRAYTTCINKTIILFAACMLGLLFLFTGCSKGKTNDGSKEASNGLTKAIEGAFSTPKEITPQNKEYFEWFDTVSDIYSYAGDSKEQFEENCRTVAEVLDFYNRLFDIYHEYSGLNNLCTINKNASGEPLKVAPQLIDFLLYAKDLKDLTDGEMDITMGAVLSIWHAARTSETPYLPTQQELEVAAKHIGFDKLEINRENNTVRLTDPYASLDVGALGKGYAAEQAAQALINKGVTSYVLNLGGNIKLIGTKADGSQWVTGIRNPQDPNTLAVRFSLSNTSCVTSGSYERFFTVDGVNYPHIIDKDTLWPARYYESVSVITQNSALADALSTALFCMPYEQSRHLVESLSGVDCLWIFSDGTQLYTEGIKPL